MYVSYDISYNPFILPNFVIFHASGKDVSITEPLHQPISYLYHTPVYIAISIIIHTQFRMMHKHYTSEEDAFQSKKDACRNKNSNLTFVPSKALGQARKPSIVYYKPALGNTYQYIQSPQQSCFHTKP